MMARLLRFALDACALVLGIVVVLFGGETLALPYVDLPFWLLAGVAIATFVLSEVTYAISVWHEDPIRSR
jgi:hypothetical protein